MNEMHEINAERLGDIIGRLYEAALDPSSLAETGECLRQALGIQSSIMFACDRQTGEMRHLIGASENFDAGALQDYRAHYHDTNPWYQRARVGQSHVTRMGEELISETEFRKTEFASDWCNRVDIHYMMGTIRQISDNVVVGTGVHRSHRQGSFGDDDLRLYGWLSNHLGRALQVSARFSVFEGQRLAGLDTLHDLGVGMALLDNRCRPVFLNALAERLASRSTWLTMAGGRFLPTRRSHRNQFEAAVNAAAATSGGQGLSSGLMLRLNDPVEGNLLVTVAPFRSPDLAFGPERPVALVQFADPDRPRGPHATALMAAYGLSPGEARLVEALVSGVRLPAFAQANGVSVNTARTQLARAFDKTQTRSQQDLLVKVLSELRSVPGTGLP